MEILNLYPRIFDTGAEGTVYFRLGYDAPDIKIKIQAMEAYEIKHTPRYRIDEEDRYPYLPMTRVSEGLYSITHKFTDEQRYSIKITVSGKIVYRSHIYALSPELRALSVYKIDTHLHSNRSDGEGSPFEVALAYRAAGYDAIAITDHHRYAPSIEARDAISKITSEFAVFPGEEVHNKDMGYFHIINLGGSRSVNEIIETDDEYVEGELKKIKEGTTFPENVDIDACAYRIFVANEIRRCGGTAIMAHPFWDAYGEYHMQTNDFIYHWEAGTFDALELLAACDESGNGDNLQVALWADMRADGARIPVVGASDSHSTTRDDSLFNKHFSLVFANGYDDILTAIKSEYSVAINRRSLNDFFAFGSFRLVKYSRFLLGEYFPLYTKLTRAHSEALSRCNDGVPTEELLAAEEAIRNFKKEFFGK